jgi:hypothetical protein
MQAIPSATPLSRTAFCTSSVMSVTVRPPAVRKRVSCWNTFIVAAILRESLPDAEGEPPHPQWILQVATLPRVRAFLLLAVAGIGVVTACGAGSATRPGPIRFGLTGGNIVGYAVSIEGSGRVTIARGRRVVHRRISVEAVRRLGREIERAHLAKRRLCTGVLPDIATQYIRLGKRTSRLHGTCEPRFQGVWNDLLRAVGPLPQSRVLFRQAEATTSRTSTLSTVTPSGAIERAISPAFVAASSDSHTDIDRPPLSFRVQ